MGPEAQKKPSKKQHYQRRKWIKLQKDTTARLLHTEHNKQLHLRLVSESFTEIIVYLYNFLLILKNIRGTQHPILWSKAQNFHRSQQQ